MTRVLRRLTSSWTHSTVASTAVTLNRRGCHPGPRFGEIKFANQIGEP